MKKWIAALAVLALIVGGWYVARKQRFTAPWAMPKTAKVTRGFAVAGIEDLGWQLHTCDTRFPISALMNGLA